MNEIVIDANVFAHALNTQDQFFASAAALVLSLVDSDLKLAVDDTGKKAPDKSTSHMLAEYNRCISPFSLSANVISTMLMSGRVVFHPRLRGQKRTACKQLVPANHRDAIVLGVGMLTDLKLIVSNDYLDFHAAMRSQARKHLGVNLIDSDDYHDDSTGGVPT